MTHDELLEKIDDIEEFAWKGNPITFRRASYDALRAVVELHKPYESADIGFICAFCKDMNSVEHWYPCPTIQAIEKELE